MMIYYRLKIYNKKFIDTAINMITNNHSLSRSICNRTNGCSECMFGRNNNYKELSCVDILGDNRRDTTTPVVLKKLQGYKALYEHKKIKRKE